MARTTRLIIKVLLGGTLTLSATVVSPFTQASASASVIQTQGSAAKTAPGQARFGDRGPAVVALQKAIMRNGFTLKGGADGVFDQRTRRVLRTFQRVVGLKVTGVVDAATARVLKIDRLPAAAATPVASNDAAAQQTTPVAQPAASAPAARTYPLTVQTLPVRGQRGQAVLALQTALATSGITFRGGIDGLFGSGTAAAVAQFQKNNGLNQTGIVDRATAVALGLIAPAEQAAAASASSSPTTTLTSATLPSRGDRGRSVRALQRALQQAGFTPKGGVDGVFGGATAVAIRKFQESKGLRGTGLLDTRTAVALSLIDAPRIALQAFPVQGPCFFSNTWHAPRPEGRLHLGVDIIAAEGRLIYAVVDGVISRIYDAKVDKRAGNGVRLLMEDGTYFFYGHLSRLADGIQLGTRVKAGQIIGYNGRTGNTSTPHLHFEVHPQGGDPIDPTEIVAAVDACHVTDPLPQPDAAAQSA